MNFQTHNWYPRSKAEKEREGGNNLNIDDIKNHEQPETEELRMLNLLIKIKL